MFETSGLRIGSIAGIDVSVSMWFGFLIAIIIAFNGLVNGLLFALALTISVLIHEFGHAVVCKYYKLSPSILLHGFGGLCMHRQAPDDWKDILIVVMGPIVEIVAGFAAFGALAYAPIAPNSYLQTFVVMFAWVSVIWGFANLLLPLWPLDGGRLLNLLLRRFVPESKAQNWTLKVSMFVAIPVAIAGIFYGHFFVAFLAFFIIIDNYRNLESGVDLVGRKAKDRASDFTKNLLGDARTAFKDEDFREAYRLCHQVRAQGDSIPPKMQNEIWEILGVSAVEIGEHEEALGWLKRAPDSQAIREARSKAEADLAES